jgi:uncharacterized cofD-like protein
LRHRGPVINAPGLTRKPFTPARAEEPAAAPDFPRIVALGGGTGLPVVLRGLASALHTAVGECDVMPSADLLAAIVTVTDDGGSSGRLRRDLGVLPPGDIRNCLAALSSDAAFKRLLAHRFDARTDLDGHAVGNLLLAALMQMTGSFAQAIDEMARLLKACGRVYPSTIEDVTLRAELANGEIIDGETAIVGHPARIRRLALARHVRPWPDALRALINADAIVVGPGSLYTSVLPNLLVDSVASTLSAVGGARILVANLMTQPGETDGLSLDDHLRVLREHTGRSLFDYVLVNRTRPTTAQLARYRSEGAELIPHEPHSPAAGGAERVEADLLDTASDHVRHDSDKLAAAILEIARRARPAGCRPIQPAAVC